MTIPTFTKTGNKATTPAKLPKGVFGLDVKNHDLLKQAYVGYLANGRTGTATTKTRGEVRGGGRKPWRQKGTGRARFGSIRVPIWRGGGVTFGPTGEQNYKQALPLGAKRQSIRQALSLSNASNGVSVIESFDSLKGKTSEAVNLLDKLGVSGSVLLVVDSKTPEMERSVSNLRSVKLVQAQYLNAYDILNASQVIMTTKAVDAVEAWLGGKK
jgi:large subunit ribosomal protein L4